MADKQVLVIGGPSLAENEPAELAALATFFQSSLKAWPDIEVFYCLIDECNYVVSDDQASIFDSHNNRALESYDLVIFRRVLTPFVNEVVLLAHYLKTKGVSCINSTFQSRWAPGKLAQAFYLHELGLPVIPTISTRGDSLAAVVSRSFGFPVIVKSTRGAKGKNNYLVRSLSELEDLVGRFPQIKFMAQPYIVNEGDYRLLLAGEEVLIIHRRSQNGSHLNNTSQGGTARLIDPDEFPQEAITMAKQFAQFCKYEIAGVDIIIDANSQRIYILEINSLPELETGVFIEAKKQHIGAYLRRQLS